MTNINDFEKVDGTGIDWAAYDKARIEAGELCRTCHAHIFMPKNTGKQECMECRQLVSPEAVDHESFIRCPKCKGTWNPRNNEDYEVFEDGQHKVSCPDCDHDFEISTSVSYSFESPELLPGEDEDEAEEGEVPDSDSSEGS